MKRILLVFSLLLLTFTLTACDDVCVGPECVTGEAGGGTTSDSVITFEHIDGHGDVTEREAYIMFEFESLELVKYQVSYLSCTCRDFIVNYWQVAYIIVERQTNTVQYISYGLDQEDHYTAGMWGDSSPTPTGKTLEDFTAEFLPWITGKGLTDLEGISVFTNEPYFGIQNTTTITDDEGMIDDYAGSSVATNNIIRIVKTILTYHEEKYN